MFYKLLGVGLLEMNIKRTLKLAIYLESQPRFTLDWENKSWDI